MKVRELIAELQKIEDKEREIQVLIGDEHDDHMACDTIQLTHTDDVEQCVEIFCNVNDCYTHPFPHGKIIIDLEDNII